MGGADYSVEKEPTIKDKEELKAGPYRSTTSRPRPKNQTNCSIRLWPNKQIGIDSENSQIGRSRLKAISVNRVNVPLRAIFVNSPILCMYIYTPRANIMLLLNIVVGQLCRSEV